MMRPLVFATALALTGTLQIHAGHHHGGGHHHHGGGHHHQGGGGHHGGGWHHNNWGWYPNRRAQWGLAGLAAGAVITSAIQNSRAENSPTIIVPETNRNLDYNIDSSMPQPTRVNFTYYVDGMRVNAQANCMEGLINGNEPRSAEDVHTLNAVCHALNN